MKVLRWIWQLPQNLIGFLLTRKPKATVDYRMNDNKVVKIYFTTNVFGCGVSLGDYIILDYGYYFKRNLLKVANHEHGHQKQSLLLGWLYLLIVGLSSAICNNLWDRLFHKNWSSKKSENWYYSRFPEKWADKLGGVKRI